MHKIVINWIGFRKSSVIQFHVIAEAREKLLTGLRFLQIVKCSESLILNYYFQLLPDPADPEVSFAAEY